MTHASLFSGIGACDLAAEWMGWNNLFHCEWNPFGQRVLKHHFPQSINYHDITKTDFTIHRGQVDVLTGGFPCQPYSTAGKQLGKADERHLFPEMLRCIKEVKPRWVIGENVRGLVSWNGGMVFDEVCADLESEGYEVQSFLIPASSVNAPHKRERIWFIANSMQVRLQQCENGTEMGRGQKEICRERSESSNGFETNGKIQNATNTNSEMLEHRNREGETRMRTIKEKRIESFNSSRKWETFPTKSPLCGGDDGIPRTLDSISFPKWRKESIMAYGNAIVPQVAYQIFKTIQEYEIRNQRS
jgi:DNA (cytosine-5)-methyltransferase 1